MKGTWGTRQKYRNQLVNRYNCIGSWEDMHIIECPFLWLFPMVSNSRFLNIHKSPWISLACRLLPTFEHLNTKIQCCLLTDIWNPILSSWMFKRILFITIHHLFRDFHLSLTKLDLLTQGVLLSAEGAQQYLSTYWISSTNTVLACNLGRHLIYSYIIWAWKWSTGNVWDNFSTPEYFHIVSA